VNGPTTSPLKSTAPLETSEKYSVTEPPGILRPVENHRSFTRSFVSVAISTSRKSTRTIMTLYGLSAVLQLSTCFSSIPDSTTKRLPFQSNVVHSHDRFWWIIMRPWEDGTIIHPRHTLLSSQYLGSLSSSFSISYPFRCQATDFGSCKKPGMWRHGTHIAMLVSHCELICGQ
jgi:hypothetical protein